eukprot:TRINITY_DN458_c0_g2_i3.p1 TRINITY_DN458_c0_g2~~TRINITY_DN458_c0_g2_i3.p1  ORF type:complete len:397 (+),score=73.08 TRINITY_DN458_c0_g2_i3:1031-2221(+)
MQPETKKYDLIVVGAGVAGCCTALSVLKEKPDTKILLIETLSPQATVPHPLGQSIPPDTKTFFNDLGVLNEFLESASIYHEKCHGLWVSWRDGKIRTKDYNIHPLGYGYSLDMDNLNTFLRSRARKAGVELVYNTKIVSLQDINDDNYYWDLKTEDQVSKTRLEIRSRWIVDATGRKASVARLIGNIPEKIDNLLGYAVIYTQSPETLSNPELKDELNYSLIESAPNGWWYSCKLPKSDGKRLVIYFTDDNLPEAKIAKKTDGYEKLMKEETYYTKRLIENHNYQQAEKIFVTASGTSRLLNLDKSAEKHWTAVGDAAITFDPLSSQGIITALRSSLECGKSIAKSLSSDSSITDYINELDTIYDEYLSHYNFFYSDEQRWRDNAFWKTRRSEQQN